MNGFDYDIKEAKGGGVIAYLRTAKDGELKPILQPGGKPQRFGNRQEALQSLLDNIVAFINGHYVRDGEVAGETAAAAEAVFKAPLRQKGKTRVITVGYKGQRQRCERNHDLKRLELPSLSTVTAAST